MSGYSILQLAYLAKLARRTDPVERVGIGPRLLFLLQAERVEWLAAHMAVYQLFDLKRQKYKQQRRWFWAKLIEITSDSRPIEAHR